MPYVAINSHLEELVKNLGELRIATPVEDPSYETIELMYRNASDSLENAIGKAIDSADQDYQEFVEGVTSAIASIHEAQKKIEKVAKAVKLVAKVLDIAGKIAGKLIKA